MLAVLLFFKFIRENKIYLSCKGVQINHIWGKIRNILICLPNVRQFLYTSLGSKMELPKVYD